MDDEEIADLEESVLQQELEVESEFDSLRSYVSDDDEEEALNTLLGILELRRQLEADKAELKSAWAHRVRAKQFRFRLRLVARDAKWKRFFDADGDSALCSVIFSLYLRP